jgi:rRNA maturation protein Nop10
MFKCINCGFAGVIFHAEVASIDQGSYTYRAKCPKCGSHLVIIEPPVKEQSLRISLSS